MDVNKIVDIPVLVNLNMEDMIGKAELEVDNIQDYVKITMVFDPKYTDEIIAFVMENKLLALGLVYAAKKEEKP